VRTLSNRLFAAIGEFSPNFWAIWLAILVNRMANFVAVFLALFLRQKHGFSDAQAGWVVGLWGIGSTAMAPISGALTDHLGRRRTMLLGLVLGGLSVIAIAFAKQPLLLTALAFIGGATQQCFYPASNAAIADVVPSPLRARAYGRVYWAANLGLTIGFSIAGFVPETYLFWLFLADAATTLICAGLIARYVPETRPEYVTRVVRESIATGFFRVLSDRVYLTFALLHLCALIIFTQFQMALPLDMENHGISSRGFSWLMAFNCAGVVLLQPWLTPMLERVDSSRLLAASTLLFGFGYVLNAYVSTLPMYLIGAAFWTLGEVVGFPAASTLVAELAPLELRGRYQGVFSMVWGLAMGLSPIIGGEVMERLGAKTLWIGCLQGALVIAVLHLACARSRREKVDMVRREGRFTPSVVERTR
jgi:MFS family permease